MFKPERWLDSTHQFVPQSPYKFIQFNAGPRLCLGRSVALHESGMLLSNLVKHYIIKLVPHQTITYELSITLPIKNGLQVTIKHR